jgi:transaldolase/glucose-6-phosphate isomerase
VNPLHAIRDAGQSVWLDFLRRGLLTNGGLLHRIRHDAVSGVTSNPTIFARVIVGSTDYDEALLQLATRGVRDPRAAFLELAIDDVRMAADLLRPIHEDTGGVDGYVSFELDPGLAHDADGSVRAAHDLTERIGKPNVMIKVPGTSAGARALEELTAAGVHVNVTLLFSVAAYEQVARAYQAGLTRRLDAGLPVDGSASVASFFVSRVDTVVDPLLPEGSPLQGWAGIANAKLAYQRFLALFSGERWERLAAAGARVQRPLWASTGTKNPAYPDTWYVEALVGPDTVDTMPEATMDAVRDHGRIRPRAVVENVEAAEATLRLLPEHGIDLDQVTRQLLDEGLAAFDADTQKLQAAIEAKLEPPTPDRRPFGLQGPRSFEERIEERIDRAEADEVVQRVWQRDHTLWCGEPDEIVDRLGWLDLPETMRGEVRRLHDFAHEVRSDGFTHAVLLGMGGASLPAGLYRGLLGRAPRAIDLIVLDTTHPDAVTALDRRLDMRHTLFVVASKSGATIETLALLEHYFTMIGRGDRFVAITDRGTPLEAMAQRRGFRTVFVDPPGVGGRWSALSLFGLVPAALLGVDLDEVLETAAEMAAACNRCVPCDRNPGLWLGTVLGEAAQGGWDKLTLLLQDQLRAFGPWAEQLVAESSGKGGTGIVPVLDDEGAPVRSLGADRAFVALREHPLLGSLDGTGGPVARLGRQEPVLLGAEVFRWQFAVAVACHALGVNPFDQPQVEEAKQTTSRLLARAVHEQPPDAIDDGDPTAVVEGLEAGQYLGLLAYVDTRPDNEHRLRKVREALRDRFRVATTLGFGPRYLHSTGQLHKGGPPTGAFLQVVDDDRRTDLMIPGRHYTFGELIDAQALGDLVALRRHGRPVARVRLSRLEEVAGVTGVARGA